MSALRKFEPQVEEQHEAEILYLLIPPHAAPKPKHEAFSLSERMALLSLEWSVGRASKVRLAIDRALVTMGAGMFLAAGLYMVYTLKSLAGIDLFKNAHLENFVPVPGFGRW